jgi:competence protein ComEA
MPTLRIATFVFLAAFATAATIKAANPLQQFDNCTLEAADWSDGDSFPVKLPNGETVTVRLYGVDCLEMHLDGDESNARRLRDQRRWFGIADIQRAKSVGEAARTRVGNILAKPFTVLTTFADARGDPRYKRVYGFVTTASGLDLAEQLVKSGMARAYGVYRERPDGTTAAEWREHLRDLELLAARNGAGAWAHTDWEKLPEERQLARAEEAEIDEAMGVAQKLTPGTKIDPNTASRDELLTLPGIGDALALRIIENRPYRKTDDLLKVPGIGEKNLETLRQFIGLR